LRLRSNPRIVFTSAIFLLFVCAVATSWILSRAYSGETWVRHTYSVQILVGEIESDLARMGRARQVYLQTGEKAYLREVEDARTELFGKLSQLKVLVHDNAVQEELAAKLEQAAFGRTRTLDESLQLVASGNSTHEAQDDYSAALIRWSLQTSAIAKDMRELESNFLERRLLLSNSLFGWVVAIFALTFLLSIYMLWEHYRILNRELAQRKLAERNALNLSAQLLNAQDQERRKVARDLHDGLGQNLAGAKMIVDTLITRPMETQRLPELSALLEDAISSIRSMSHLLHPPLVDELGFVSAARSYLEGFSRRTGVVVDLDLPNHEDRLPQDLELTLFRVLQESLTNIQRHSKSARAEVRFTADSKTAALKIRDYGVGLPPEMIRNFNQNGTDVGVGLAGMKERVRERNGSFEIRSDSAGTSISVTFPMVQDSALSA
jgi:signal transduction histidine kinase